MEKVKLSKAELALLDALIADMQEGEGNESTLSAGSGDILSFIGGITRIARRAFRITVKVTPIAARAAGVLGVAASGDAGAKGMSELLGNDGETLSVNQLIELRKAAS